VTDRKRAAQPRKRQPAKTAASRGSRTATRTTSRAAGTKNGNRRPSGPQTPALLRQRRRMLLRLLLGGMVLVALLFAFVFPARTLLAQRQQTEKEQTRLDVLLEQNSKLEAETRRLQNDAEIERIAREQYNFVRPGEHPYVVVPPPTSAPPAPTTSAPATSPAPKR
jgi:cell division protein FtsB